MDQEVIVLMVFGLLFGSSIFLAVYFSRPNFDRIWKRIRQENISEQNRLLREKYFRAAHVLEEHEEEMRRRNRLGLTNHKRR